MIPSTACRSASTLVVAEVGEIFNACEKQHGVRVLNHQRVTIHAGRSAAAHHANHSGEAAVILGRIQDALVNQSLLVRVLVNVVCFNPFRGCYWIYCRWSECCPVGRRGVDSSMAAPVHPGNHAPIRGLLQCNPHIHGLTRRSSEPLNYGVVRPRCENLPNPVAALIGPMHLRLSRLEIEGAEIIPDLCRFGKIELHEKRRDCEVRLGVLLDRAVIHVLESERHGYAVFSGQHQLPHLRKNIGDVWSLQGFFHGMSRLSWWNRIRSA